jgi:hypothetical protein
MSPVSLAGLAEDPERFLAPPAGAEQVANDRFCVTFGSEQRWARVCRLRLPEDAGAVAAAVTEIRQLTSGAGSVTWNVGSSATPGGLPQQLRALGLHDPEPRTTRSSLR